MNPDLTKAQTPEQMAISGANGTPTNQAITPSALTPATPIQPTVAQPIANPTVPDFLKISQPEQQAQDQYSGISQQIASLTGELAGRDAFTTGQQQQQDIIGKQANVTNYQNQLKALQQGSQGIELRRQQAIQEKIDSMSNRGIQDNIVQRHAAIDNQYRSELLTNSIQQYSVGAQYAAAQGDLTSALNYVDQAVKLKYQPIEAQLTAQQANLQAIQNSPNFTSAQKKQAAAQQLQLQLYTQQIADEKKKYNDTQDAIIQTVHNNPVIKPYTDPATGKTYTPQQIQAAISASQSPAEVARLVNYFGLSSLSQQERFNQDLQTAKFKQDERQFGLNYALQKDKFEEDKRQFGINTKLKEAELEQKAGESNLDPSQLIAYAQQYATTGQIPTGIPKGSFGTIAQYAKEAPKAEGTLISKTTGVTDSKVPATEQQDFTRLATILKNVERLKALDEKRIGGVYGGTLGKVFGSNAQAEYLATRKAIVDDISRMQSGAALTADEVAFYEDYLPGRFSESYGFGQDSAKKIANFETIMRNRLNDRLNTNNLSIVGFSKVKLDDGNEYTVGQILTNDKGQQGRVNADGSITIL